MMLGNAVHNRESAMLRILQLEDIEHRLLPCLLDFYRGYFDIYILIH